MFWQAAWIGIAIAAPVGPIGLLCISRTLRGGPRLGLATGLGAASADGLFALSGAWGSGFAMQLAGALARPLGWAACLLLAWLGIATLRRPAAEGRDDAERHPGKAYLSALLLTLGNPMTILSFAAVAAALSGGLRLDAARQLEIVAGVFCGSAMWWLLLSYGGGALLLRLGPRGRRGLDFACGLVLFGFAIGLALRMAGRGQ
ncbi:LysE family translocator [Chromobacterium amazonense]|uniref:LysE family translocator n=1 Tax=Chromobacterium amazonense TaxID=1382803 RepID=UPI0031F5FB80